MFQVGNLDILRTTWWWSHHWRSLDDGKLRIIDGDWTHPEYQKWGTIKQLVNKARRLCENNGFRLSGVEVVQIEPHTAQPWIIGRENEAIVYVPLATSYPLVVLYEGPQSEALIPGKILAVGSNTAMRSLVNHGDVPSVCIVFTLQRESEEA